MAAWYDCLLLKDRTLTDYEKEKLDRVNVRAGSAEGGDVTIGPTDSLFTRPMYVPLTHYHHLDALLAIMACYVSREWKVCATIPVTPGPVVRSCSPPLSGTGQSDPVRPHSLVPDNSVHPRCNHLVVRVGWDPKGPADRQGSPHAPRPIHVATVRPRRATNLSGRKKKKKKKVQDTGGQPSENPKTKEETAGRPPSFTTGHRRGRREPTNIVRKKKKKKKKKKKNNKKKKMRMMIPPAYGARKRRRRNEDDDEDEDDDGRREEYDPAEREPPPTTPRSPGFSAAQVLEQISSSVHQEDKEDYCDSEEEDVSEDEDGEEYNPERDADDYEDDDDYSRSCSSSEEEREGDAAAARVRDIQPDRERARDRDRDRAREPERERETLLSKNGKIKWSSAAYRGPDRPRAVRRPGPAVTPGPTAYAESRAIDIASSFRLFVTPAIERIIVDMTNLQGVRKYGDGWRPMDSTDLRAYVGLLILAGVYRSRGEAAASLWDAESGRTVFRATMPLKVFHKYSRLLRFDDRQSRPARLATDRLAAVREVWDLWEERLQALYNPGPEVTVDEQLVPFRGRCPFRQYIPSKPAKYGIKSWVACDAKSSYAWKMQVYTGKAAGGGPEKNQGARVVLDLTEGLPAGHNVTCDNFFTSYELGQRLLERDLTMVGTVRKNKPELPPALLQSKDRQVSSSRFAFTPTATLVSYLAKRNKNVLLLSTRHAEPDVSDRRDRKPALILDYNRNKGGVDNLDKVVGTYSCRRMTARWPLVIFHNILDVSSYNAFVIWREINPDWMPGKRNKRRVFLEQLGKALVKPLIQRRQRLPAPAASALVKVLRGGVYPPTRLVRKPRSEPPARPPPQSPPGRPAGGE
ncbi:piggyBac transposable element-derived protein 4-like [Oncorhynchus masou masou]|uniref:piggyBac transposable element-derived protein 4-like n=1 Tax=Oncorhynchus masou masou TaxID=90313 RepID=UPI003183BD99